MTRWRLAGKAGEMEKQMDIFTPWTTMREKLQRNDSLVDRRRVGMKVSNENREGDIILCITNRLYGDFVLE